MKRHSLLLLGSLLGSPDYPAVNYRDSLQEERELSGLEKNLNELKENPDPDLERLIEKISKNNITLKGFKDRETLEKFRGGTVDIAYELVKMKKDEVEKAYITTLVQIYDGETIVLDNGREIKVSDGITKNRIIFALEFSDRIIEVMRKKLEDPKAVVKALKDKQKYAKETVESSLQAMRESFSYNIDIIPEDFISLINSYAGLANASKILLDKKGIQIPVEIPLDDKGFVIQDGIKWKWHEDLAALFINNELRYVKIGNKYHLELRI